MLICSWFCRKRVGKRTFPHNVGANYCYVKQSRWAAQSPRQWQKGDDADPNRQKRSTGMEPSNSTPVFIDVESSRDQYLQPQEFCQSLLTQGQKANSSAPVVASGTSAAATETHKEISDNEDEIQRNAQPETDCLNVVARRVRCPECPRFTTETGEKMLRHIKKVHRGENPFQCYMCDYGTYNKCLFEEHVRIHQGIKPFQCKQCDYKSAAKKNLKKHELIHRPDNPLRCDQCDFIARHHVALKSHKETHANGAKQCEGLKFKGCKFAFKDMEAYKKHQLTHKVKCDQCDFKTCQKPTLKRHYSDEHPMKAAKQDLFSCQICGWKSNTMPKVLLHLIHHPKQKVDESAIDISILRKHGIMA